MNRTTRSAAHVIVMCAEPVASADRADALRSMGRSTSQKALLSDNPKYRTFYAGAEDRSGARVFCGDHSSTQPSPADTK
jgi:hypothetical protein